MTKLALRDALSSPFLPPLVISRRSHHHANRSQPWIPRSHQKGKHHLGESECLTGESYRSLHALDELTAHLQPLAQMLASSILSPATQHRQTLQILIICLLRQIASQPKAALTTMPPPQGKAALLGCWMPPPAILIFLHCIFRFRCLIELLWLFISPWNNAQGIGIFFFSLVDTACCREEQNDLYMSLESGQSLWIMSCTTAAAQQQQWFTGWI